MLKPGGTITVIEGDHGSTCFHPDSEPAREAIACQVRLQRHAGDRRRQRRGVGVPPPGLRRRHDPASSTASTAKPS